MVVFGNLSNSNVELALSEEMLDELISMREVLKNYYSKTVIEGKKIYLRPMN